MNYLEEQTDEEAMINSIKNSDQPLPRVSQLSIATSSTEQPSLKDKSMWSDQEKKIQNIDRLARSLLIQGLLTDIYSLIGSNKTAKDLWDALTRHMLGSKYREQDKKADVFYEYETFKTIERELLLDTYIQKETVVVTSDPLDLIAGKQNSSSCDDKIDEVSYYTSESKSEYEYETSEYYDNSTTYGLFVDNNEDQEIFHDSSENFSANLIESQIDHNESDVTHNNSEDVVKLIYQMIKEFDKKIAKYQKPKDLRPTLYDERVINLGYTLIFLTHSNEALEIKKFKRARENKIEFAYDYGNLNHTSSLKPYVPTVILEKIIIDLEAEVVSLLSREKENLEILESLKSKGFESSEKEYFESENQSENDC
nr:integrase, catalytic region, zinc finger, CCHC-type, peptidase aspartic, catalytic [Tanacetum cinerariifolium]